jgi:hypothetical protein
VTRKSLLPAAVPLVVILLALGPLACGRTGLDAPVHSSGAAGQAGSFAGAGVAGTGVAGTGDVAGASGGMPFCENGTGGCADRKTLQTCSQGVLQTFACPILCINGACAQCNPGAATCLSNKQLQTCDRWGTLQSTTCPGACVNGACVGECVDGDTRCLSATAQQTCKGGTWTPAATCSSACVGNACVSKTRRVFVTSQTFVGGNLGGLPGGDDACRTLAVAAGLGSSFVAWLSDSTGSPSSRFAKDAGPYTLVDGTIIANSWSELTSGVLQHGIDLTEVGGPPPRGTVGCVSPAVWSGTQNDGQRSGAKADCGDWSDPTSQFATFGSVESTTQWSEACEVISGTPSKVCGGTAALYCFEQ